LLSVPVRTPDQAKRAFALGADLVEWDRGEYKSLCDASGAEVHRDGGDIISYHNYEETPQDLEGLLAHLRRTPARYYKIAAMARSTLDSLRMLRLCQNHPDVIGLCMGEEGKITRILAPVFGVPIMYASLSREEQNAPGQVPLSELINVYRFREIGPRTPIYGLIGDPVGQSVGHLYHNLRFLYVKMRLAKEELAPFFAYDFFQGLSVTMPLKEAVIPFLDSLDPAAHSIGAVNTISGKRGYNTDGEAALDAIGEAIGPVQGKKVAVIGAGGAGKAIAYAAQQRGAKVVIANRTAEKAALALPGVRGGGMELLEQGYDVLVKAIPVEVPFDPMEGSTVMDICLQESVFLARAKKRGCRCISGLEMYVRQADRQQKIWAKKPAAP